MLPSSEWFRVAGTAFACLGIVLSGFAMADDADDPGFVGFMAISAGLLFVGGWIFVPDVLTRAAHVFAIGGYIFYVGGIVASVAFASKILVIG
jgi:hypothetical protein